MDLIMTVMDTLHHWRAVSLAALSKRLTQWTRPRFLIRDNDAKYGAQFTRVALTTHIETVRTPIRAPRANAIAERFLGSVRRDCLDHLLILSEHHLLRVLRAYSTYFNTARPHHGIGQALPALGDLPSAAASSLAPVRAIPVLAGLHHDYQWVA